MDSQNTNENKKGFLQNDKLLVCSMFVFYGLCIIGLIAGAFIWLRQRNATISANATSTAQTVATEKANATATAIIRATEQAQYEFIENFDSNQRNWRAGQEESKYWIGSTEISGGIYKWNVIEVKETFISWADVPIHNYIHDFDLYVDTKITDSKPGNACSGVQFRVPGSSWDFGDHSGYYFGVCNNGSVKVSYEEKSGEWERIATRYYPNYRFNDWNRLEVIARGSHFQFFINGELIYEMDDDREKAGELELIVELNEKEPATILFDNLGLEQHR